MITIKLLENNKIIQRKILMAMARQLNIMIRRSLPRIEKGMRKLVGSLIMVQPEIGELSGGILQGAFGIPAGKEGVVIQDIVRAIVDSVYLQTETVQQAGSKVLKGGLNIYIQPNDFSNLLGMSSASVSIKDGQLPWLQWLLTAGDAVLIGGYNVTYGAGLGRSGLAQMRIKTGAFRVPPSYSGTEDSNFITRAFLGTSPQFTKILQKNLK